MIRLTVTDQPKPSVTVEGPDGSMVDLTRDIERAHIELDPQRGSFVVLTLAAEVDWNFPVQRVSVTGDPLADLTEHEITTVLNSGGMSSSPAARLLAHLRARTS